MVNNIRNNYLSDNNKPTVEAVTNLGKKMVVART